MADQVLHPTWIRPFQGEEEVFLDPEPEGAGPVSFALSESVISDSFLDYLEIEVRGLSLGQTVRLERFLVDNDRGEINSESVLLDSRLIQDGRLPLTGAEPNYNETLDYIEIDLEAVTFRDGEIYSYFPIRGGLESIPGEYVYRVSSPSGSFAAQTERLTIEPDPMGQFFEGRVTSQGQPVAGALVGILQSVGGYSHLRRAAVTDAEGHYIVYAPFSTEYDLVATAPGFVGPFAVGTGTVIEDGEHIEHDLELIPGERTVSGSVVDDVTGTPIPGLPVTFLSGSAEGRPDGSLFAHTWTDSRGQFQVQLTAGIWGITFKPSEVSSRSYLSALDSVVKTIDTREGGLTDVRVPLTKGTCLIGGTLLSEHEVDAEGEAVPLEGVEVFAINVQQGLTATGVTYEDGWFNLAVTPGHWRVFPFSYDLEAVHHPGSTSEWVSFTGPDQSVEIELSAPRMGGVLDGFFRDHDSEVVGKLRLLAFNQSKGNQESIVQTTYEGSGYYNFYLGVGDWVVIPDAEQAADRQLLFMDLPRVSIPPAGDPFDDNWRSISVDSAEATGTIEVFLRDSEGRPVPQMKMHGMMTNPAGTRFECFGVSDQNGLAVLPVVDGVWEVHLGTDRLREAGKREFPLFDVVVAGERTRVEKTLVEMTGEPGRILSIVREEKGRLRLEGRGEPGERYLVEGGSDLENWMALGQVTALEGVFTILDSVNRPASELSARGNAAFYRILPLE